MISEFIKQSSLIKSIFESEVMSPEMGQRSRGLEIYRRNLRATAAQALTVSFPTIAALIGSDAMYLISERLLNERPPNEGDWGRWGEYFPDQLEGFRELKDYPFLSDSARLDFICHQLVRAEDEVFKAESLAQLEINSPDEIRVVLSQSLILMETNYPIVDIRHAHQLREEERNRKLLNINENELSGRRYITCFRNGYEVNVIEVQEIEYRWLKLLKEYSLGESMNRIDLSRFSFDEWLLRSVRNNLISEFKSN